jgi:hypothetical protein
MVVMMSMKLVVRATKEEEEEEEVGVITYVNVSPLSYFTQKESPLKQW